MRHSKKMTDSKIPESLLPTEASVAFQCIASHVGGPVRGTDQNASAPKSM